MINLEECIFDPENLSKCKTYRLLSIILQKRQNAFLLSPSFFYEIFKKELEHPLQKLKEELWDPPENFEQLNFWEKIHVYIEQFSEVEFLEFLEKTQINFSSLSKIFKSHIQIEYNDWMNKKNKDQDIHVDTAMAEKEKNKKRIELESRTGVSFDGVKDLLLQYDILRTIRANKQIEAFTFFLNNLLSSNNLVLFTDKQIAFDFQIPQKASIIISTVEDYQARYPNSFSLPRTHPLLLKEKNDIHLLLNFLSRDLAKLEEPAYLKSIKIQKYFSLRKIHLENLQEKKEIYIVGENGDGKTLFLQALLLSLKGVKSGIVSDYLKEEEKWMSLIAVDSKNKKTIFPPLKEKTETYPNLFAYGVNRHLNDSDKKDDLGYLTLFDPAQYLNNPVKWLQYLHHKESIDAPTPISLETAIEMIKELLNENVEINVTPDEVQFKERGSLVQFQQLSEGYKSVLIWTCDLVERLSKKQDNIKRLQDFRGIVLIDEIDLHLHPKWKYVIVRMLRRWFPEIQFFFTTHSPTVLLGSSPDAIFCKIHKEKGVSKISRPLKGVKNLMYNTLVTSPLFGMKQARAANSEEENIDTNKDFLQSLIHREVAKRIKEKKDVTDEDILAIIQEELDIFGEKNDKD